MPLRLLLALVAIAIGAATAHAQTPDGDQVESTPPHLSVVDGQVQLERDGRTDAASEGWLLLAGDRLSSTAGRAEITLGDGSTVHLDTDTTFDLLSDSLFRLLSGRLLVTVVRATDDTPPGYRIDTPAASVQPHGAGEYRIRVAGVESSPDVELAVLSGSADLVNDRGTTTVRAGQFTVARADMAPERAVAFNSAAWDTFDRWSQDRRTARLGASSHYLPSELRTYSGVFDRHGSWVNDTSYGYVWYPYAAAGWRPYYNGSWSSFRRYGWTWIGHDPWGWPTHHFGRWTFTRRGWGWIPARRWAPAWVSWAIAPGFVGWCPLGFDGRPVFGLGGSHGGTLDIYRANGVYDPWRAWTVVPQHAFGGRGRVAQHAVPGHTLRDDVRGAFVTQFAAPRASIAVPRTVGSIGSRTAVPRTVTRDSRRPPQRGREIGPVRGRRGSGTAPRPSPGADSPTTAPAVESPPGTGAPPAPGPIPRWRGDENSPYGRARRVMERPRAIERPSGGSIPSARPPSTPERTPFRAEPPSRSLPWRPPVVHRGAPPPPTNPGRVGPPPNPGSVGPPGRMAAPRPGTRDASSPGRIAVPRRGIESPSPSIVRPGGRSRVAPGPPRTPQPAAPTVQPGAPQPSPPPSATGRPPREGGTHRRER